jgi:hypothetical protein
MLRLLQTSLILTSVISCALGSEATGSLSAGNEPISQSSHIEEAWNTQAFLEQMLREEGALKPGQHLAPHEVWRIADFLKARIKARRVLQRQ